ncbi:MAG: peptidase and in kexin sedolisin [Paenibacillus sp.]|nr:peptidase and in kexin sedolisin [Paenibacillus sp.]
MIKQTRRLVEKKAKSRRVREHLFGDTSRPASAYRFARLLLQASAWVRARAPRTLLRRALLALLLGSVTLTGLSPAGPAAAAAPAALAAEAAAAGAPGADEEQPQSWLLKWRGPALAHELRGTEVLRRQDEAAVLLVRPADEGADVQAWLRRLRSTPGVEYVHPNFGVHVLTSSPEPDAPSELSATTDAAATSSSPDAPSDAPATTAAAASAKRAAAAAAPKTLDPDLSKQPYLDQIGVPKGRRCGTRPA